MNINESIRGQQAKDNFNSGYNCSQSVLLAYEDYLREKGIAKSGHDRSIEDTCQFLPLGESKVRFLHHFPVYQFISITMYKQHGHLGYGQV